MAAHRDLTGQRRGLYWDDTRGHRRGGLLDLAREIEACFGAIRLLSIRRLVKASHGLDAKKVDDKRAFVFLNFNRQSRASLLFWSRSIDMPEKKISQHRIVTFEELRPLGILLSRRQIDRLEVAGNFLARGHERGSRWLAHHRHH